MAAPRGPLDDSDDGIAAIGLGERIGQGDDVEAPIGYRRIRRDEALEEEVPELLVVAVELAVGRDERKRRDPVVREFRAGRQPGQDTFAGEAVGIGRGLRLERDRGRQARVVEDGGDRPTVAEVDAVGPAGVEPGLGGLPRGEDRVANPFLGGDPQRLEVNRGFGQPEAGRAATEAQLELAQPPADLRPPVGGRGERQNRVVERLADRVAAGGCRRERGERRRVARRRARRRASGRGPTKFGRGCPVGHSAGSTPRPPARSSRGTAPPTAPPGRGRSTGRSGPADRSARGRRDGRGSRTGHDLTSRHGGPDGHALVDAEAWFVRPAQARSAVARRIALPW